MQQSGCFINRVFLPHSGGAGFSSRRQMQGPQRHGLRSFKPRCRFRPRHTSMPRKTQAQPKPRSHLRESSTSTPTQHSTATGQRSAHLLEDLRFHEPRTGKLPAAVPLPSLFGLLYPASASAFAVASYRSNSRRRRSSSGSRPVTHSASLCCPLVARRAFISSCISCKKLGLIWFLQCSGTLNSS